MEVYGIKDLSAFDEKERYHIRTLHQRREYVRLNGGHTHKLRRARQEELDALDWIFVLLSEISEEEEF